MKPIVILLIITLPILSMAQDQLPYRELSEPSGPYTAPVVVARMVDGLGFRYYWATEGLRDQDLQYKPSSEARSTEETLDHILGLAEVILNSVKEVPNESGVNSENMSFDEKRSLTLQKIKEASELLMATDPAKLGDYKIVFQRGGNTTEFPFWYQLNGPIADAIWHVGQVVTFRRSSGNPIQPGISFLSGTVKD